MVTRETIAQSLKGLASKDEDLNLIPRLHDLNKTKQTRKKEKKWAWQYTGEVEAGISTELLATHSVWLIW